MKFKVPEDVETFTECSEEKEEPTVKEVTPSFEEEIKNILKLQKVPTKFIMEGEESNGPEYKLKLLTKYTQLCQEEIIPRHGLAMETIQSKSDDLRCKMICQQKNVTELQSNMQELRNNLVGLKVKNEDIRNKQSDLSDRLKLVLQSLHDRCKDKTIAERNMAQDLVRLKENSQNLNVRLVESKSKMNYYKAQVKAQTEVVRRQTKPLYLDKNRAVFMRGNLSAMKENIENLVERVKTLKSQTDMITDPQYSNLED